MINELETEFVIQVAAWCPRIKSQVGFEWFRFRIGIALEYDTSSRRFYLEIACIACIIAIKLINTPRKVNLLKCDILSREM